jgi:hypothetical protein
MYVVELKSGKWICSESKKRIIEQTGKPGSVECSENVKNLWYQPFNYLSGVMSDFFWTIKDGVSIEKEIPMRGFDKDLPLSKCIEGDVEFLGNKLPKWYRDVLSQNGG